MIALLLTVALGEVMWGEQSQNSCYDYDWDTENLTRLTKSQCKGVGRYYIRFPSGKVGTRKLVQKDEPSSGNPGFSWSHCQNKHGTTVPFDEAGKFKPECMPDTLYSWQRCERVKELELYSNMGEVLPLSHSRGYLYAWRTPMSTSTYNGGKCSIRIKLKPGVRAIKTNSFRRKCHQNPEAQRGDAVIVNEFGGHEYIICNSSLVESWSTETSEHFNEIEDEWEWVTTHDVKDFDSFSKYDGNCVEKASPAYYFRVVEDVRKVLHKADLKGRVYLSPGATREGHFKTKDPSYFNPRGLK